MKRLLFVLGLSLVCAAGALAQDPARLSAPPPGIATAAPPPGCDCGRGHWWDPNRKSCVTGACDVPNMPDGDKGGGYFAWHGSLFINTPCLPACRNLDKTVATGQAGWTLVSSPGVTTPKAPVVVPAYSGWGTVPGASWVSVDANHGNQGGDYVYEYQFCLCARVNTQTVGKTSFTVKFLADNGATVYLNSTKVFATTGNRNFSGPPRTVTYTGGPGWVAGTNKIRIVVNNDDGSPTGLAASLTLTSDLGCIPVP
jgi:hypothetical protein